MLRPPGRDPKFSINGTRANPRLGGTGPIQNERQERVSSNGPWGDKLKKTKQYLPFDIASRILMDLPRLLTKKNTIKLPQQLKNKK
jgi:hypothetical protein